MSAPSLANQLAFVLDVQFWTKEDIDAYKAQHRVVSVKRALRPDGDPRRPLPAILSHRTRAGYFQTALPFFRHARELAGKPLLRDLLKPDIVRQTLDMHYRDHMPSTLRTLLAAIGKVHQGCVRVGWTKLPSSITDELRRHVKGYREDGGVRQARFGYREEDGPRIIQRLRDKGSVFALPAETALLCGLRLSEIAGLKGEHVELETMTLHITGKGGRRRDVPLPAGLADQLDPSRQYLFTPSRSWKQAFYQAVRKAARELGITVSGVHRLRANYAQAVHKQLQGEGMSDLEARKEVSGRLGHNRVEVTREYIPTPENL